MLSYEEWRVVAFRDLIYNGRFSCFLCFEVIEAEPVPSIVVCPTCGLQYGFEPAVDKKQNPWG